MSFTDTYNENTPNNATQANKIDDEIVTTEREYRERLAVEHCFYADETGHPDVGEHKKGSARIGFGADASIGPVNANNPGRVYKEAVSKLVKYDNGVGWEELFEKVTSLLISGGTLTITDANGRVRKDSAEGVNLESLLGVARLAGKTGTSLNVNCTFDGTNWNRIDTATKATRLSLSAEGINVYKASAGANPITWDLMNNVVLFTFSDAGVTTLTGNLTGNASNALSLDGITPSAYQKHYIPSDDIILEKLPEVTTSNGARKTLATLTFHNPGQYRFTYDIRNANTDPNAAVVGLWNTTNGGNIPVVETAWSNLGTTYVPTTADIWITPGTYVLKLYGLLGSPDTSSIIETHYTRNIRVRGTFGTPAFIANIIS